MLTRINFKEMGEIRLLNKSVVSNSTYYSVSFGITHIKVRVSDHYNKTWNGHFQIVVHNPKNLSMADIKSRSYPAMEKQYNRNLTTKIRKPKKKK